MIETGYRAGLFGEMVAIQAKYYAKHWNFAPIFEFERLRDLHEFSTRFNDTQDLILRVEGEHSLLGAMVIDGSDPKLKPQQAHLRWFILDESLQGKGMGSQMMQQAMGFLEGNYHSCYLDTFEGLSAARKLYEKHGFKEVKRKEIGQTWDANICKQYFEWLNIRSS